MCVYIYIYILQSPYYRRLGGRKRQRPNREIVFRVCVCVCVACGACVRARTHARERERERERARERERERAREREREKERAREKERERERAPLALAWPEDSVNEAIYGGSVLLLLLLHRCGPELARFWLGFGFGLAGGFCERGDFRRIRAATAPPLWPRVGSLLACLWLWLGRRIL